MTLYFCKCLFANYKYSCLNWICPHLTWCWIERLCTSGQHSIFLPHFVQICCRFAFNQHVRVCGISCLVNSQRLNWPTDQQTNDVDGMMWYFLLSPWLNSVKILLIFFNGQVWIASLIFSYAYFHDNQNAKSCTENTDSCRL